MKLTKNTMKLTKSGKHMYCTVCARGGPKIKIPDHLHVWEPATLLNDRCIVEGCHESRDV